MKKIYNLRPGEVLGSSMHLTENLLGQDSGLITSFCRYLFSPYNRFIKGSFHPQA